MTFSFMIGESVHVKAPVRAVKFMENDCDTLIWSEGDRLISDKFDVKVSCSERIIGIETGLNANLFVRTEFKLYRLNGSNLKNIPVPIRDRVIAILDEGEKLWVVQSRGAVLLFHFTGLEYTFIKSFALNESSSVFYSASIIKKSLNVLEIAFGTIFSGILITSLSEDDFLVIQSLEGHKGTIFDIKHHPNDYNMLVSCSDDRSVRVWSRKESLFESKAVLIGHEARVWSFDVKGELIASVSEDNTCRVWCLKSSKLIQVIEGDLHSKSIWSVSLNSTGKTLAFGSNDGSVVVHDLSKQTRAFLIDYCLPESFGNIKNMVTCPGGSCFVVTDNDQLVNITSNYAESVGVLKGIGKYSSITFCMGILYIADGSGCLFAFDGSILSKIDSIKLSMKISRIFAQDDALLLETVNNENYLFSIATSELYKLDLEKDFKVTSFLKLGTFVFIGTRQGILLIFEDKKLLKNIKISENESLKSIKYTLSDSNISVLDRTGVETVLKNYEFNISKRNRISKGVIEGYFGPTSSSCFHQHSFIVSDPEAGVMDKIYCGGGHRLWDASFDGFDFTFAFMANGKLTAYSGRLDKVKLLSKRSHGKEIRTSLVVNDGIVLSGSEDGLLLVCNNELDIITETRLVNVSIKCMTSTEITPTEHIIFIGGSNESIEVYKFVDFNFIHISTCPKQIEHVETRVLCLDVRRLGSEDKLILLAGYSDASIRIFEFDTKNLSFSLLRCLKNVHSRRCVQQIRFISEISVEREFVFISAGADGLIQAWQQELEELWNFKAHESGINAIDTKNGLILTGGEGGAISLIELNGENRIKSVKLIREAHNSTVTGVKLFGSCFISASIDRFINFYNEAFEVKQRRRTVISDISSISLTGGKLTTYGAGMESFKLEE